MLALIVGGIAMSKGDAQLGGATEFVKKSFTEGFYAGDSRQFEVNRDGEVTYLENTIAGTATTTLEVSQSGSTVLVSGGGGNVFTLPAVTNTGANFRFQVSGAIASGNAIIDSAEGDNIEGSLIVAGAVVGCDAVDQINFITDGENIGDYVELLSDGTQWLLVDSGVLTSAKMTCTDPS